MTSPSQPKPKTKEDLEELPKDLLRQAKQNLEQYPESFQPVAFPIGFNDSELTAVALPHDKEGRDAVIPIIHLGLRIFKKDALIMILDAYGTSVPDGMSIDDGIDAVKAGRLRHTRREALIMTVCGRDLPTKMTMAFYHKDSDGKVIWDEEDSHYNAIESWMIPKEWQRPVAKGTA